METVIKLSKTPYETARNFATDLVETLNRRSSRGEMTTLALSGGSTPALLFTELAEHYGKQVKWDLVHFFWGDERCVPPGSIESNYGNAWNKLLSRIEIPPKNIHRIIGEADPMTEAERYAAEISSVCRSNGKFPVFDIMILGLGEDGHTASIFPGFESSFSSSKVCEVAIHPASGQRRVTVTGSIINAASEVVFLVTGAGKAEMVAQIIESPGIAEYPAACVEPLDGVLKWYLDLDAASLLCQSA